MRRQWISFWIRFFLVWMIASVERIQKTDAGPFEFCPFYRQILANGIDVNWYFSHCYSHKNIDQRIKFNRNEKCTRINKSVVRSMILFFSILFKTLSLCLPRCSFRNLDDTRRSHVYVKEIRNDKCNLYIDWIAFYWITIVLIKNIIYALIDSR